jgi:hypothetical protein
LRCYNKLEFAINMKIHSKDQTKKIEEENVKSWPKIPKSRTLE